MVENALLPFFSLTLKKDNNVLMQWSLKWSICQRPNNPNDSPSSKESAHPLRISAQINGNTLPNVLVVY